MKKIITLVALFFLLQNCHANNAIISNVSLVNSGPDNVYVQFDISWENSWRVLNGPANYDGVWVFFKYKTATGNWTHLTLNTIATADLIPAALANWRSPYGAVLHRSATNIGNGNITATGIRLAILNTVPYNIELRAFAVEMVYIPATAANAGCLLGDGNGVTESPYAFHTQGTSNYIFTGNFISVATNPSGNDDIEIREPNSFSAGNSPGPDGLTNLPIDNLRYPVGSAMWCMKYEVTQGAYRDFLNTLTLLQQTTRTASLPTSSIGTGALTTSGNFRNFLEIKTPSISGLSAVYGCDASNNNLYDEAADGEFVACNFLNWPDLAAWLDWAGLAPMTELSFEKICRGQSSSGFNTPVMGEFAWGSTAINTTAFTLTTPFAATEMVSNASAVLGNANFNNLTTGPLRNGIFATATSNRITSGASYYGVMDLSGNLTEVCVSVGNVAGRSYGKGVGTGAAIGNGILSTNGNAAVNNWPGSSATNLLESITFGEVTNVTGIISRGGDFEVTIAASFLLRISDRSDNNATLTRLNYQGGRGVIVLAMY